MKRDDKKKLKVGVFDSGRGGLSLVKELMKFKASFEVYYIADLDYHPYGARKDDEVKNRAKTIARTFIAHDCDLILVACNTATAVAIEDLRLEFSIPFVGIEPYLTFMEREKIFDRDPEIKKNLYVLVTPLMAKSKRFQELKKLRDPEGLIENYVCPDLASIVEDAFDTGWSSELELRLEKELRALKDVAPSHIILGCTHYPLIKAKIEAYTQAHAISPCPFVAKRVLELLNLDLLKDQTLEKKYIYYSTSSQGNFRKINLQDLLF